MLEYIPELAATSGTLFVGAFLTIIRSNKRTKNAVKVLRALAQVFHGRK